MVHPTAMCQSDHLLSSPASMGATGTALERGWCNRSLQQMGL